MENSGAHYLKQFKQLTNNKNIDNKNFQQVSDYNSKIDQVNEKIGRRLAESIDDFINKIKSEKRGDNRNFLRMQLTNLIDMPVKINLIKHKNALEKMKRDKPYLTLSQVSKLIEYPGLSESIQRAIVFLDDKKKGPVK